MVTHLLTLRESQEKKHILDSITGDSNQISDLFVTEKSPFQWSRRVEDLY